MARSCTRRNAGGASINDSGTFVPIPVVSRAPITTSAQTPVLADAHAPAQAPALTPVSASVLGPLRRYIDKNLHRTTKLALELFVKDQEYG